MKNRGAVNNGSALFMSTAGWEAFAKESDEAAKRTLMAGSRLQEVERLASKAEAAAEAARRARDEFNAQCQEYNQIPARIDQLTTRLAGLNSARAEIESAPSEFRTVYAATLSGHKIDAFALMTLAGVITTKDLRLDVISEVETDLKAELKKLQERQSELKRALGVR